MGEGGGGEGGSGSGSGSGSGCLAKAMRLCLEPRQIWLHNPAHNKAVIILYAPSEMKYVESVSVKNLFELKFTQVCSRSTLRVASALARTTQAP